MDVSFLEHWADVFVARGYSRYLTLSQFLSQPQHYCELFDGPDGARPLLPAQQRVQPEQQQPWCPDGRREYGCHLRQLQFRSDWCRPAARRAGEWYRCRC